MRAKKDIADILAKRKFSDALNSTSWGEFISMLNGLSLSDRDALLTLITAGHVKKAGELIKKALYKDAKERALTSVTIMLADDRLSLAEIDSIL